MDCSLRLRILTDSLINLHMHPIWVQGFLFEKSFHNPCMSNILRSQNLISPYGFDFYEFLSFANLKSLLKFLVVEKYIFCVQFTMYYLQEIRETL